MKRNLLLLGGLLWAAVAVHAQPPWSRPSPGWGSGRFYEPDSRSMRSLARELEERTDMFKRQFDHQIDRTRWDETPLEDHVWNHTKRLENAVDGLRSNIDRGRNDDRVRRDLSVALQSASEIDRAMRRVRLGPDAERNWQSIRSGLFELARVYRMGRY